MRFSLLLVPAGLAFGCGKSNPGSDGKGGNPPGPTGGTPDGGAGLTSAKPDHTATAADWHAEFKKDKAAATAKYAGKVIELTGTLSGFIDEPDAGVLLAYLKVGKDAIGARCALADMSAWEKATEGAEVTIRGKLADGGIFTGEIKPAVLVNVDKNPALTATAADLGKQCVADVGKLRDKYGGKWVYVEGEVVSNGKPSARGSQFVLKGDGDVNVICWALAGSEQKVEALKPGQKVKALGELNSPFSGDKSLNLKRVRFKEL